VVPKNIGIAFVYCDWGRRSEQTATNLIKSISQQLVEKQMSSLNWANTRLEVQTFLQKCRGASLLDDYLAFLTSIIGKYDRVMIIVDALDELDGVSHREEFVKGLLSLSGIQLLLHEIT
jgi:hypothetical protein